MLQIMAMMEPAALACVADWRPPSLVCGAGGKEHRRVEQEGLPKLTPAYRQRPATTLPPPPPCPAPAMPTRIPRRTLM